MKKIMIKCPVCHLSKEIAIPKDLVSETSGINTITIHKNVICPHTFQFFLDRTFEVRGYQQVDYEFEN